MPNTEIPSRQYDALVFELLALKQLPRISSVALVATSIDESATPHSSEAQAIAVG